MNKIIDLIINLCKWPIAIFLLISIPGLIRSFDHFDFHTYKFYALFGGALFYGVSMVMVGYNNCMNMQVISHELTHIFFAYLTLHKAGRIRLNPDGSGGSMFLQGRGNWLITLSPYFFPLFAFIYMLIMPWLLRISDSHWLVYAVFGYFLAYYWGAVISQVHPGQTDIIREGYVASLIIIIGANLYVTGIIFAFNSQLWSGIIKYVQVVQKLNEQYWPGIIDIMGKYAQQWL